MQGLCRAHMLQHTRPARSPLLCEGLRGGHLQRLSARSAAVCSTSFLPLDSLFYGSGSAAPRHQQGACFVRRQLRRRLQQRSKQVQAAFFGVGAPEALLVGVVALVVFGPKGLAEAVKSLGATFRAVSPTIKELVSASSDLRTSLEEQIGLDEIRNEFRTSSYPRPSTSASAFRDSSEDTPTTGSGSSSEGTSQASSNGAASSGNGAMQGREQQPSAHGNGDSRYFSEDFDVDIEAKRREAAKLAWGTATGSDEPVPKSDSSANKSSSQEGSGNSGLAGGALAGLSLEELEAELTRRKSARSGSETGSAKNT